MSSRRASWSPGAVLSAHAAIVVWLFWGSLFEGRVLFFRDIFLYYFPNYVFVERSLAQGVWPLWNHASDLGAPFLLADPLDLLLLAGAGASVAMRLLPPLYLWIGMAGTSLLAGRLGRRPLAAWGAGALYGCSGLVLSSVSLFEYFHAVAWAPLVIAAFLRLWEAPGARRVVALGGVAALLVATLSLEIMLQAGLVGLLLLYRRPDARRVVAALGAGALAAGLTAPVLLGAAALLSGTSRSAGFPHEVAFAWSASPMVLLSGTLPRLFGDPHTWSESGFWGQPYFQSGQPYFLSLYLGPIALGLAAAAGRRGGRLWILVALGTLLAMGDRGPIGPLMGPLMTSMRVPVKFLWMATLALCLLGALGLERLLEGSSRRLVWCLGTAGTALGAAALACTWNPEECRRLLALAVPALAEPRAAPVLASIWPQAFGLTAALTVASALAVWRGRALAPLVAVLATLDLIGTHEGLNATASSSFYTLRPPLAAAVARARRRGTYRWFSYGLAHSPGVTATREVAALNSDLLLFYVDRQALIPRTPVLDRLESAFDLDRVGWAPSGSTLSVEEKDPRRFAEHYAQLRLANVRWVMSFHELPRSLVVRRESFELPEVGSALHLYELRDPLPRAFWVGNAEPAPDPAALSGRRDAGGAAPRSAVLLDEPPPTITATPGSRGRVRYERIDPHTVRLHLRGDPGWIAILDNYHPDWKAEGPEGPERLYRAYGGYQSLWTPGGNRSVTLRYRPKWLGPGVALAAAAAISCAVLLWARTGSSGTRGSPTPGAVSATGTREEPGRAVVQSDAGLRDPPESHERGGG